MSFDSFSINILIHSIRNHSHRCEIFSSCLPNHFFFQICTLCALFNLPRKLFSRNLLFLSTLSRLNFGFGASFLISIYILTHSIPNHSYSRGNLFSCLPNHFFFQICTLYALFSLPRKLFSRHLSVLSTLSRLDRKSVV